MRVRVGARKQGLSRIEIGEKMFNGLIVNGEGEVVDADGESVGYQVWGEISVGLEDLSQQGAHVVTATGQMFPQQRGHGGLSPISNHLDGVDEVLALGA